MYYYLVGVRSARYHGSEPLTYTSSERLRTGQLVRVELQRQTVLGLITGVTTKPRFTTKPIVTVYDLPLLPAHLLRTAAWLQQYYPAPLGIIMQQLIPGGLTEKQLHAPSQMPSSTASAPSTPADVSPDISDEAMLDTLPNLTAEQQTALDAMTGRDSYLLHGVTGSGKTRIYMELASRAVASGQSAIILTPEISLTAQLAENFRSIFGKRVIVMHSQQTPVERQRAWLDTLQAQEPVIVIGPRSALFSPVAKLGLIVLDEAHETAYKQEQAPQYQTGRVAAYMASQARSTLVLGSATPSVSDYYLAEQKHKPIITITGLAQAGEHPPAKVEIIDRRQHDLFSRSPFMSLPLIKAMEAALGRGEQTLLYLNRRGTARLVLCENCGWQATCPHCDVPLTYHGDHHQLRCHSCNYHTNSPTSCPDCGHADILYKTAGTKAIVQEVERLFPQARIARFDTDNARAERFEQHYETVKRGEVDILVGTQLLAKGLDLPRLSTLGVLLADTSLYLPDFSAAERTFQLLSQVLGRIGRGHLAGQAFIQTYNPDHPVLADVVTGNYHAFYKRELDERRQFLFPPLCYLLKLSVRRATIAAAETAAEKLKAEIIASGARVRIEGPAPAFYERFQNKFQWQLVVKATNRGELLKIIEHLPANWSYDLDPLDLL